MLEVPQALEARGRRQPWIMPSSLKRRLGLSVLVVPLVIEGIGLDARQRPVFRSIVEVVSLSVTVTDEDGRHVGGLAADDFLILEDGEPQQPVFFSRAAVSLSVSMLLDSSASMEGRLPQAQEAANEFIERLRPGDVVEIMDFDTRAQVLQPFTADRGFLRSAIDRVAVGGSTALFNAVYIALRQFERLRAPGRDEIRREIIVVLSDGEDTSSLITFDELSDLARRSHTVIYPIGLGLDAPRMAPRQASGEFGLRRLAQETGGRLFLPQRAEDLSNVYEQIADELTSQYVLGYRPTNGRRDGTWRAITVRVNRPGSVVRTRPGYYASIG